MIWQSVLDVIDAVESWIAGQSYWVQVALLLAVFGPLCYLLAGLIDRLVEAVLAWHSRRDQTTDPVVAVAVGSESGAVGSGAVGSGAVGSGAVGSGAVGSVGSSGAASEVSSSGRAVAPTGTDQ